MVKEKRLWYKLGKDTDMSSLDKVFNLNYQALYMNSKHKKLEEIVTKLPKRTELAIEVDSSTEFDRIKNHAALKEKDLTIFCKDLKFAKSIKSSHKYPVGLFVSVNDRESLDFTVNKAAKEVDFLGIDFKDPTNIPLELVLAKTQGTKTNVFKRVSDHKDGEVSLMTMEQGSDGIIFENNEVENIVLMEQAYERSTTHKYNLQAAEVLEIQHAGMGDRVCIDTTSELTIDEGMLLGSTSTGGLMVCSETHYLPYMNLRPFRVNAGGLHMYVWGPNNFVAYLSELKAGDEVYAVNSKGEARIVTVGRVKIERRPLLKIKAKIGDSIVNTFIQDDWHVRVFNSKGAIVPSAEVKIGDKLLGYIDEPGRHVGVKISETIKEQ